VNIITRKPHDADKAFELSKSAATQLAELIDNGHEAVAGRILEQIGFHVSAWSPGEEDGEIIKHLANLSRESRWAVYRLKFKPQIQQWRVFFFFLNGRVPPIREIEEIIKFVSHQQCYDDMRQPHLARIRSAVLNFSVKGDIKVKKRR
jgi:hypothetical protein